MQKHCQSLCAKLKDSQEKPSAANSNTPTENAWTRRPRLVFDLSSVETTGPAAAAPQENHSHGGLSIPSQTPKLLTPGVSAPAGDPPSIAGTSAQKSLVSTDLSTIISHFDTAMSRQEDHHRQMMQFLEQSQATQMEQTKMMTQLFSHLVQSLPAMSPPSTPAKRSATTDVEPAPRRPAPSSDTPMDDAPAPATPHPSGLGSPTNTTK